MKNKRASAFSKWLQDQFEISEKNNKPHAEYVPIGKDEAEVLLSMMRPNRNISASFISAYGRDLIAGNWIVTHQGMAFDVNRQLFDGQHRCKMLIETKKRIMVSINFGLPVEAADVTDKGKPRRVVESLAIKGKPTPSKVIACMNSILRIEQRVPGTTTKKFTGAEIEDALGRYHRQIESAIATGQLTCKLNPLPASVWGPAMYVDFRIGENIIEFIKRVAVGAELGENSPEWLLSRFVSKKRSLGANTSQANTVDFVTHTLYAIRMHVTGREITKFGSTTLDNEMQWLDTLDKKFDVPDDTFDHVDGRAAE